MTRELFLEKLQDDNGKDFYILGVYKYVDAFGPKQVYYVNFRCQYKGKIEIKENDLHERVLEIITQKEGLNVMFEDGCFQNLVA